MISAQTPPTRPKRSGHRRVGSHGNPPIKLDAPANHPHGYFGRMSSSTSNTGEYVSGDVFAPASLGHSRSWAPEQSMISAANAYHRTSKASG